MLCSRCQLSWLREGAPLFGDVFDVLDGQPPAALKFLLTLFQIFDRTQTTGLSFAEPPHTPSLRRQRNLATVAKACAGLAWCVNPCQIVYEHRDTALRFLAPPGEGASQPSGPGGPPQKSASEKNKGGAGGRLWAGRTPTQAPAWATFSPGLIHTGRQSAVAYATKTGHLIQVRQ